MTDGKGLRISQEIVSIFYESLLEKHSEQWEKPSKKGSKNWLKTGYAYSVINIVFVSMVEFYGGLPRYKSKWNGKQYEPLIRDFTADLSDAILDPRVGFNRENTDITKAANDSLRKEFATDILVYLRSTHSKYKELAPELDDDTSLEIVASTVLSCEKVEVESKASYFRCLCSIIRKIVESGDPKTR